MSGVSRKALLVTGLLAAGVSTAHAGIFFHSNDQPAPAPAVSQAQAARYVPEQPAPVMQEQPSRITPEAQPVESQTVPTVVTQEGTADPSVQLAAMEISAIKVTASDSGSGVSGSSTAVGVHLVNSKNIRIDFETKNIGSSGLGRVELYYTRNGQIWRKYSGPPQTESPFLLEVNDDGLYGFTLVATSGVGLGRAAPQPGDVPQVWVEVDTAAPEVHLLGTQAGLDGNGRTLTVRWTATDKNLVARPITLSYAEQSTGPWTPFATNLDNTGAYTWRMSTGMPSQVLLRVEATDRIGNVGQDETQMPTPIDLSRPEAAVTHVGRNGTVSGTPMQVPTQVPTQVPVPAPTRIPATASTISHY